MHSNNVIRFCVVGVPSYHVTNPSYPDFQEFAACASGRTVSVAWTCRDQLKVVQDCMIKL